MNNENETDLPLEPKTISSMQTLFSKIFAVIWIAGFGFGTIALWTGAMIRIDAPPGDNMKWNFLAMWMLGSLMLYSFALNLKRVRLSGRTLFISNYFKEIQISGDEIGEVTENKWLNHHPITIHFRHPTEFGEKITFMPKIRWFGMWSPHPIADELRKIAQEKVVPN